MRCDEHGAAAKRFERRSERRSRGQFPERDRGAAAVEHTADRGAGWRYGIPETVHFTPRPHAVERKFYGNTGPVCISAQRFWPVALARRGKTPRGTGRTQLPRGVLPLRTSTRTGQQHGRQKIRGGCWTHDFPAKRCE